MKKLHKRLLFTTSNEYIWVKKILTFMHGLKSAISDFQKKCQNVWNVSKVTPGLLAIQIQIQAVWGKIVPKSIIILYICRQLFYSILPFEILPPSIGDKDCPFLIFEIDFLFYKGCDGRKSFRWILLEYWIHLQICFQMRFPDLFHWRLLLDQ